MKVLFRVEPTKLISERIEIPDILLQHMKSQDEQKRYIEHLFESWKDSNVSADYYPLTELPLCLSVNQLQESQQKL